jgi:hypothetical protein
MAKRKQTTSKNKGLLNTLVEDTAITAPDAKTGITATTEIEPSEKHNYAGILIANEAHPLEKGTLGGVLVSDKGDLYGLTCFHTVKHNKDFKQFLPDESLKVISENGKVVGDFNANTSIFNDKLDIALIKLTDKFHNKTIDSPTKIQALKAADIGTPVYFYNDRIKKKATGFILRINQEGNWALGSYEKVIFVANMMDEENCYRISDKGDSGSWLLRVSDNALLGVVFSNSSHFTFVMPITEVLEAFKLKNINLSLNLLPE